MYNFDCKRFTGYKPCEPYKKCADCGSEYERRGVMLLIINLDALGDVLRNTCLLPALKRKYPESFVTWITSPRACALLGNNPLIDRVVPLGAEALIEARSVEFHAAFNLDKSVRAGGLLDMVRAQLKHGFTVDGRGVIIPVDEFAGFSYSLGLDDELKFKTNRLTDQAVSAGALDLPYERDEYVFEFTARERRGIEAMRGRLGLDPDRLAVGLNTGSSDAYPYKRFSEEYTVELARRLGSELPGVQVLLLGGVEDTERNARIAAELGGAAVETPTRDGLRAGLMAVEPADVVVTGDTLGLHMAVALKKFVVAWFGLSCQWEIDLYDRGEKIGARVDCGPCWNRECDESPKCFESVPMESIIEAVKRGAAAVGKIGGRRP